MWISAKFHLLVIRTFDAAITGELVRQSKQVKQTEAAYFARYPEREKIRRMASFGAPYWFISERVGRTAGTVGKAVRHMCTWGVIDALKLKKERAMNLPLLSKLRREQHASRQLSWNF
jgi:hypothetical protein